MPKKVALTYRHDSYASARGKSHMLDVRCFRCSEHILVYQKDGPGPLKRMYVDRILTQLPWVGTRKKTPDLYCASCKELLAIPIIYAKENRRALRLFVAAVRTKKITLKKAASLLS